MPEWLIEEGIGEDRAILRDGDEVIAARLSRHGRLSVGLVANARLIARAAGVRRGTLLFDNGEEALVDGLPKDAREGAPIRARITRERMAEKGRHKRAQARATSDLERAAPSLADDLRATGVPLRVVRRFPDDPWPDLLEEALDGTVPFAQGSLTVSPTPAMTVIDIDGTLPPLQLALAAVPAIAATLARLDLAGSIGLDFPSVERREDRRALDEALAAALAGWPHQRTAMNGFGFVQLVAKLQRPSLLATVQYAPYLAGALLLLRRAEDVSAPGIVLLTAHPRVIDAIPAMWRAELQRRIGRIVHWQADLTLAPLAGFAQAVTS